VCVCRYDFLCINPRIKCKHFHLCECREMVVAAELPMPITWYSMPFRVDIPKGMSTLLCHYIKEDDNKMDSASNPVSAEAKNNKLPSKIGQKISNNDVLRVQWVDKEEAEVVVNATVDYGTPQVVVRLSDVVSTVEDDDGVTVVKQDNVMPSPSSTTTSTLKSSLPSISAPQPSSSSSSTSISTSSSAASSITVCGEVSITDTWNLPSQLSSKVYKKDRAGRKQPYVDLLVAKELALKGASHQGGSSSGMEGGSGMHEGGFATLYRLMAGEQVGCPLCLEVSQSVNTQVLIILKHHYYLMLIILKQ
jgi:hypothetical protein